MRPVTRGDNPINGNFSEYRDAFPYLCSRLGSYCSYCERRIVTNLAVEHIQPKGLAQYAGLIGNWNNFLLGCVNCNATKQDKEVALVHIFLPDRDNTFAAFHYTPDGRIEPGQLLSASEQQIARDTLRLTGLEKSARELRDENGRLVAADRISQRMEVWLIAEDSLDDLNINPSDAVRKGIVRAALAHGFFSVWMQVFEQDADMRQRFIEAFPGTARDCFDAQTLPISPRPANGLDHAAKI